VQTRVHATHYKLTHRYVQRILIATALLSAYPLYNVMQINCVVMGGVNTDELGAFVELTKHQQLDVRFIEWMPFDDNRWNGDKFVG
jgi:molybdenum cofactor biosynthesis enzyme MoaA